MDRMQKRTPKKLASSSSISEVIMTGDDSFVDIADSSRLSDEDYVCPPPVETLDKKKNLLSGVVCFQPQLLVDSPSIVSAPIIPVTVNTVDKMRLSVEEMARATRQSRDRLSFSKSPNSSGVAGMNVSFTSTHSQSPMPTPHSPGQRSFAERSITCFVRVFTLHSLLNNVRYYSSGCRPAPSRCPLYWIGKTWTLSPVSVDVLMEKKSHGNVYLCS